MEGTLKLDLHSVLVDCAKAEGFPLAGAVDLELAQVEFSKHLAHYDEWLARGYAGEMSYLVRGRDRRANPTLLFPAAKSIFCVATPYSSLPAGQVDSKVGAHYARYLKEGDYHKTVAERLERALLQATQTWVAQGGEEFQYKVCVDTSAVLERSWAALAGLGWIGKNTLLINPQLGSYLFLAEAFISVETGKSPRPLPDYCGQCTRCISACPVDAIEAPHQLNSKRCISYLTLEKRGSLELSETQRLGQKTWIAGCDICQEVCPFNSKPVKKESLQELTHPQGASALSEWTALLKESEIEYRHRVSNSALKRVKPKDFRRNLAMVLQNALLEHPELSTLRSLIETHVKEETDSSVLIEWQRCLASMKMSTQ